MISAATTLTAARVRRPLQEFEEWKAGGSVLLIAAATVAMLLANSGWHDADDALRESHRTLSAARAPQP